MKKFKLISLILGSTFIFSSSIFANAKSLHPDEVNGVIPKNTFNLHKNVNKQNNKQANFLNNQNGFLNVNPTNNQNNDLSKQINAYNDENFDQINPILENSTHYIPEEKFTNRAFKSTTLQDVLDSFDEFVDGNQNPIYKTHKQKNFQFNAKNKNIYFKNDFAIKNGTVNKLKNINNQKQNLVNLNSKIKNFVYEKKLQSDKLQSDQENINILSKYSYATNMPIFNKLKDINKNIHPKDNFIIKMPYLNKLKNINKNIHSKENFKVKNDDVKKLKNINNSIFSKDNFIIKMLSLIKLKNINNDIYSEGNLNNTLYLNYLKNINNNIHSKDNLKADKDILKKMKYIVNMIYEHKQPIVEKKRPIKMKKNTKKINFFNINKNHKNII